MEKQESLISLPPELAPNIKPVSDVKSIFLSIDGGGTKTETALHIPNKNTYFSRTGPGNPEAYGTEIATKNILEGIDSVIKQAQDDGNQSFQIQSVFAGISGIDERQEIIAMQNEIRHLVGNPVTLVMNDVVGAWSTSLLCQEGVIVISGTGSNCFGVNGEGKAWRVGGWGHLFADEGSGYLIGLDGLKKIFQWRDGRGKETILTDLALEHFDVPSVLHLAKAAYHRPFSKAEIAGFAPFVERAVIEKDSIAIDVFTKAAVDISTLVNCSLDNLNLDSNNFNLGLIGGFVDKSPIFQEYISQQIPGANIQAPTTQPCIGGLLVATKLYSEWPSSVSDFIDKIENSYNNWKIRNY